MKKMPAAALTAAGTWTFLALLSAFSVYALCRPNREYQGRNGRYVYDYAGDLSTQERGVVGDQCRRIYDRTGVRVVVLITRKPDETLDSSVARGMALLRQSTPNQFLNRLEMNTPMIVAAFWEQPGVSVQQFYVPTENADHLGITPEGLLEDKPPVTTSLDQAVEATVADVGSDVTHGLMSRTWRGRVASRSALAAAFLVCLLSLLPWIPALVMRALDGRAAAGWVVVEGCLGVAALFGLYRCCIYFGGWPEAAGGSEGLTHFAAAGLAVPLFAVVAQRMNRAHLGRVTLAFTCVSFGLGVAAVHLLWVPQSASIVDRSTNIWRMSPQLADNPLFQIVGTLGLLAFVFWTLCVLALPVQFVLTALGDDSPFVLGAIPERAVLLDRVLCLQTGKPLPRTGGVVVAPWRKALRLVLESSFGYVFWGVYWLGCLLGGSFFYRYMVKRAGRWPYGLQYDYAVRHCLKLAEENRNRGENRAAVRYASEALAVMHGLTRHCPLIHKTDALFRNHILRGELLLTQGEPEEARRALVAAREAAQGVSTRHEWSALDRLGRFHWNLGDPAKAKVFFESALEGFCSRNGKNRTLRSSPPMSVFSSQKR